MAIAASALGLSSPPFDVFNLDGLSRNYVLSGDPITNVFFSVEDRPGPTEGAVNTQVEFDSLLRYTTHTAAVPPGTAVPGDGSTAGNIYYIISQVFACRGVNLSPPTLRETTLGLKPDMSVAQPDAIQDEDNLDAVQLKSHLEPPWNSPERVYFSIATDSANIPVFTPAAIWISVRNGSFSPFASAESMGLAATKMEGSDLVVGDDVDAVIVFDAGIKGVMEPGTDKALFSVRPKGPSELDPGTVFYTDFTGSFQVAGPANIPVVYPLLAVNLGLNSGDTNADGRIRVANGENADNYDNVDALDEVSMPEPIPPDDAPDRLPPGVSALMLDFGDNPQSYGAAWHQTVGLETIGACVDMENNNQPSPLSDRDDLALGILGFGVSPCQPLAGGVPNPDDEDGVVFNANGAIVTVKSQRRNASNNYRIDAFFDTNSSGKYEDGDIDLPAFHVPFGLAGAQPGAPVSINIPIPTGPIPPGFDPTLFQSRFRLAFNPNFAPPPSSSVGLVLNGEVEDYPGRQPGMKDFGDAPDDGMVVFGIPRNYRTLLKNNGPRYSEFDLQHFGKLADGEPDGQPTPLADGDNGDEDGIIRLANSVTINVEIKRPRINTYLIDGWIDCNNNGVFDDDIDFIKSVQNLGPGPYSFNFPTPCDPRKFFSRFRLTLADGFGVPQNTVITPFGEFKSGDGFSHGEVEDYPGMPPDQLHIVGTVPNQIPVGGERSIKANVQANFTGLPNQEVVFNKVLGNFTFTSGQVSPDGKQAKLKTSNNGSATMTFKANGAGKSLVKVTVTGTALSAFSYFVIVSP